MKRAAVVIGVDKSGTLPKLNDAARGAERVANWAQAQGMDTVELITDTTGPVEVDRIKKTIKAIVDTAAYSQLLVYFAGHGVNRQRQEYWLLSDFPDDTQAAVNVAGSAALAATCGIPHIVFVSDACRTAADGVRAQSVTGSEIFPNREGTSAPVDQFFACELGRPSHEVKDPKVTAAEFSALYTSELVPALNGECPELVEWVTTDQTAIGRVHPRPLRDHLSTAVRERLKSLNLQTKVIQVPTAIISSDPPAWLAEVKPRPRGLGFGPARPPSRRSGAVATHRGSTLTSDLAAVRAGSASGHSPPAEAPVIDSAIRLARPFGVTHHETECGFKIRGARIVGVFPQELTDAPVTNTDDVRVYPRDRPTSVLLVMDSGVGALLPAIRGFLAALTLEDGELVDVAYEPSDNSDRWGAFQQRADEIRALRSIAASSLTHGTFRLERDDALEVARRMQYAKGIDPSLAVYAAYAYHDLQRHDLIREMAGYLAGDLGAPLFDVALLARGLDGSLGDGPPVISSFPLLAQGWAFLNAFRVRLHPALQGLGDHLAPSLWTLLDPLGVEQVRAALASGASL